MANKRIKLFISGFLMLIAPIVFAQNGGYIISGEVLIYDVGNVYIYLSDEDTAKTLSVILSLPLLLLKASTLLPLKTHEFRLMSQLELSAKNNSYP